MVITTGRTSAECFDWRKTKLRGRSGLMCFHRVKTWPLIHTSFSYVTVRNTGVQILLPSNFPVVLRHRWSLSVYSMCLLHVYQLRNLHLARRLRYFLQKDTIASFNAFRPEHYLHNENKNLVISRSEERLVWLLMTENFSECILSVIVESKPTLCFLLTFCAFKNGINVPLGKTLYPNNGLRS